jgi:hypothetical protein
MKQIFCPLWGFIELTPLLSKILDTAEMQRLRDIKQLGATYFVYPSATHTRLEHSLGVCHLARLLGESLQKNQPELKITARDIEIWQVAALVHDIGHGPFSHLYDHYVKLANEPDHEERGLHIFNNLCKREKINLTAAEITEVHRMVDPKGKDINHWKYQLIANKASQIDVDKIDYIQRDSFHVGIPHSGEFSRLITGARVCKIQHTSSITTELCWNEKLQFDIYSLFASRYRLHKQVYTHHTVKAFEFIIIEMMKNMRAEVPTLSLALLSDASILSRCYVNPTEWGKALIERKHPKCIGEYIINKRNQSPEEHVPEIRLILGYIIEEIKIGFVSGNGDNPLKKVHYYSEPSSPRYTNKEPETPMKKGFTIDINSTSFIIPEKFQERILRLYTFSNNIEEAKKYWKTIIQQYH